MRRFDPKEKVRRRIPIPDDLRDSLREVYELIQEAKRDPEIEIGYGDAIQVGRVRGGRYGKKPRPYVLTYYPEDDIERGKWYLTLHHTEIEDIGDGRITEISMYCCTSPECRSKFREPDPHCFYCDYFDDPNFGTFEFPDAGHKLRERGIAGLMETSTRDDVIRVMGNPNNTGGDKTDPLLGYIFPWIVYHRNDFQIRFEFKEMNRIKNIHVMEANYEPGK